MDRGTLAPLGPASPEYASLTKLARLANTTISDARKTAVVVRAVVDQCNSSQRITPLFRFLEASLVVPSLPLIRVDKLRNSSRQHPPLLSPSS